MVLYSLISLICAISLCSEMWFCTTAHNIVQERKPAKINPQKNIQSPDSAISNLTKNDEKKPTINNNQGYINILTPEGAIFTWAYSSNFGLFRCKTRTEHRCRVGDHTRCCENRVNKFIVRVKSQVDYFKVIIN